MDDIAGITRRGEETCDGRSGAFWALVLFAGMHLGGEGRGLAQQTELPSAPVPARVALRGPGGVVVERATNEPLALSLDEAIGRGLKHNVQIYLDQQDERNVRGQVLTVGSNLLPNLEAVAKTSGQEVNLAAMGFKPANFPKRLQSGGEPIRTIVKVNTTGAQLNVSQVLFNAQAYYFFRAAQGDLKVAALNTLNTRGNVVLSVGTEYLQALANAAEVENARELLKADREVLRQATERQEAGVGMKLDRLRAQVQAQRQEQALVAAETELAKDKIALNRTIGLPAGQEITLTDRVPFEEFAEMPLERAKALAYTRRKDYLALLAQMDVARKTDKAIRYGRLPTLAFGGYYGVLGETHGLYHGVFAAQGRLSIPVFQEAAQRGEREVAEARLSVLQSQTADLKVTIEAQIREAMLDVETTRELVRVASSSVELTRQALSDTRERYAAGVDDLLPLVEAQAGLSGAESRLVEAGFEYNRAKLYLARNTGVVESQYKIFLGR